MSFVHRNFAQLEELTSMAPLRKIEFVCVLSFKTSKTRRVGFIVPLQAGQRFLLRKRLVRVWYAFPFSTLSIRILNLLIRLVHLLHVCLCGSFVGLCVNVSVSQRIGVFFSSFHKRLSSPLQKVGSGAPATTFRGTCKRD